MAMFIRAFGAGAFSLLFIASNPAGSFGASLNDLHDFGQANDTSDPLRGALVFDGKGAIYGTGYYSGALGIGGSVFRLAPPTSPSAPWSETLLSSFGSDQGSLNYGVVLDAQGNVYGTLPGGDFSNKKYGEVFKIKPQVGNQPWKTTIIHKFALNDDGAGLNGALVYRKGALFGSTYTGGPNGRGTIFKLTPPASSSGIWAATVLYAFGPSDKMAAPFGLVFDPQGSIYGIGPGQGQSIVYKLSPPSSGKGLWLKTVLAALPHKTFGCESYQPPIFDAQGSLYGSTQYCARGYGTIFKVTAPVSSGGMWTPSVLHAFSGKKDGGEPSGAMAFDASGGLVAATYSGGNFNGEGTLIRLTPSPSGAGPWPLRVLKQFSCALGPCLPLGGVTIKADAIYGTTESGGAYNSGTVYQYR